MRNFFILIKLIWHWTMWKDCFLKENLGRTDAEKIRQTWQRSHTHRAGDSESIKMILPSLADVRCGSSLVMKQVRWFCHWPISKSVEAYTTKTKSDSNKNWKLCWNVTWNYHQRLKNFHCKSCDMCMGGCGMAQELVTAGSRLRFELLGKK